MAELFYPEPPLTDGVVRLRPWCDADLPCVEQASADPRITEVTTVPDRYTPEEGLAYVRRQNDRLVSGQGVSLAIVGHTTDEALGLLALRHRPRPGVASIGYWIAPGTRGRGLATRAVVLASGWGLDSVGLTRIEAWVEPANRASRRVLEASGYTREGLLPGALAIGTRRADVLVYSRA